jgi:pimeloyl-ACP methyl ester carboxylesterase
MTFAYNVGMSQNTPFQLVLTPGIGSDYRLLEPQRAAFPEMFVPPWIPFRRGESLPDYAARLAETITVDRSRPFVLGGVSMGGMLAYEMTRLLRPDATVLIASCRTRRGLPERYRTAGRLLPFLPSAAWGVAKAFCGPFVRLRVGVPSARKRLAIDMFKESDSAFLHYALQAILTWTPSPPPETPVFHIHGDRDGLIPPDRVEADRYVRDGGHLINMTHADEVNAYIVEAFHRATGSKPTSD